MLWKILSAISAACLAGAAYFAWSNQAALEHERTRFAAANANMKAAQERKVDGEAALKDKQELLATTQKELDASKEEVVKFAAEAQEKEASLAVIKGNLDQVTAQVTSVEKQIEDAGDIENLVAQIEKLKKDQLDAQGSVANQNQRVAAAKEQLEYVNTQITKLREAEALGRRGIVAPDFTARVAQYFPEWDFAILNKGNSQGVFANADLEVKRGQQVIAKLKVRNVEQFGSIADLVPGSLEEGNAIRSGDLVVAAAKQSVEDEKKTSSTSSAPATTPDATAPGAPAGGMSDPFGGTPAPAPMTSDPFGAPAAPAAPAGGMSDPFGAPAAPAGGAPMTEDPFGSAPAPAPAPAGGASMTSDPFGSN
ncbi:hypothetical protein SAMN02745166_02071 [Prosthecobacter debontii]|uniref:Uncharacterized protein n=1 Tax=Prosthecobacter debontii TaxID=48467 RepID=A0A1T4XVT4_9BACT|nr:hypothetical protein [Prosthecobacter debontii]SKA93308.1 hypothetical protein SAMN02745166_02071 [Prosthecobacter debontii]